MDDREKVIQWLKICANGCKDGCPYEYKNLVYRVECKADLMSDALDLLREQEPSSWISVKDRLPEKYNRVLMSAVDHESKARQAITIGFSEGDWWWSQEAGGSDVELGIIVTHWMPLPTAPEPPKEVSGDG